MLFLVSATSRHGGKVAVHFQKRAAPSKEATFESCDMRAGPEAEELTMPLIDRQPNPMHPAYVPAPAAKSTVRRDVIQVEHIRIDSNRRFEDVRITLEKLPRFDDRIRDLLHDGEIERVRSELKAIQRDAGLVIFSIAMHGDWLQIISRKRKAAQYVIGNVLVSTRMTQYQLAAGLYAPLRIMLHENDAGTATIEYDRPSSLFGQYGDERVTAVAKELDREIYNALIDAAG